jgi:hypothetical protein
MMHDLGRNIVVSLAGVIATVVLGHLFFLATFVGFENPHPHLLVHLAPLCWLLFWTTALGIGYFATRMPVLQSAFVFVVSAMTLTKMDYSPVLAPGSVFPPRGQISAFIRDQLVGVAIVCILAYVGAWFRKRLNIRLERSRNTTQ